MTRKTNFFFAVILHHLYAKFFWICCIIAPENITSWSLLYSLLILAKFALNQTFFAHGNFIPFFSKSCKIWDHFFPLLFPKDFESLETLDIQLQEVGAKRRLISTSKVNTRTDKSTYTKFDQSHPPSQIILLNPLKDFLKPPICFFNIFFIDHQIKFFFLLIVGGANNVDKYILLNFGTFWCFFAILIHI